MQWNAIKLETLRNENELCPKAMPNQIDENHLCCSHRQQLVKWKTNITIQKADYLIMRIVYNLVYEFRFSE